MHATNDNINLITVTNYAVSLVGFQFQPCLCVCTALLAPNQANRADGFVVVK